MLFDIRILPGRLKLCPPHVQIIADGRIQILKLCHREIIYNPLGIDIEPGKESCQDNSDSNYGNGAVA